MHSLAELRKAFLVFLQQFFAAGRMFGAESDQKVYRWDPDRQKTGIIIASQSVELTDQLSKVPAIVVARGRIMPDRVGGIGKGLDTYDWDTQKHGHVEVYQAPITIHCISTIDEESEVLAQFCWFLFWFHRDMLKARYKFRGIDFNAIDSPRILKGGEGSSGPQLWDTAVLMTVHFHVTYNYRTFGPGTGVNEDIIESIEVPFITNISWEEGTLPDE